MKKKSLILLFLFLSSIVMVFASGTYRPPIRSNKKIPYNRVDIARGQKIFSSKKIVGRRGKTCIACHGKNKKNSLSRYELLRKKRQLAKQVNKCVTLGKRVNGKKLKKGSRNMIALGAYLVTRFRLPQSYINQFVK